MVCCGGRGNEKKEELSGSDCNQKSGRVQRSDVGECGGCDWLVLQRRCMRKEIDAVQIKREKQDIEREREREQSE